MERVQPSGQTYRVDLDLPRSACRAAVRIDIGHGDRLHVVDTLDPFHLLAQPKVQARDVQPTLWHYSAGCRGDRAVPQDRGTDAQEAIGRDPCEPRKGLQYEARLAQCPLTGKAGRQEYADEFAASEGDLLRDGQREGVRADHGHAFSR